MTITREDLNPVTIQLTVACSPEEVALGFERALKQASKQIKVPGFRPGHVPKKMLDELVDKSALYDEAAEQIIKSQFKKALTEQGIEPDATVRPSVEIKSLNHETGECEFVAKVPLPPVVELGEYKGLPIQKPSLDVTDEEIDYQIEEIRKGKSTREAVTDRGVQEGDVAVVNIKPEGTEGDGRNFMLIAGQTFPELDQALAGMKVEEMKNLEATFPENFQEKDWAGKAMSIQIRINSVSTITLPELDDEFAQSLKTESVEDLRGRMTESIRAAKGRMVQEMVHEQLMEKLLERSTIHVSDNMWEPIVAQRLNDIAREQKEAGKTLEQYAQENGMTPENLVDSLKVQAKMHIQRAIMIRDIFTKEQMQISNEELNAELREMAAEFGMPPLELLDILQKQNSLDELQFRTLSRKVTNFLAENAEAVEAA